MAKHYTNLAPKPRAVIGTMVDTTSRLCHRRRRGPGPRRIRHRQLRAGRRLARTDRWSSRAHRWPPRRSEYRT